MSTAAPESFETAFAGALLDAHKPVPPGITAHNAEIPARRFGVYRNNTVTGLTNVLKGRFPATAKIVGDEFFAAMAHAFVRERPPRTPMLSAYGDELADFIAAFAPAREIAYLADVARLEAARMRAYHAADAAPLEAGSFAALDADAAAALCFALHSSVGIVRSAHPVVTIWAMNSGAQELAPIEDWRAEDALVVRPRLDVEVRMLPPGGATFLLVLGAGRPLEKAAAAAIDDEPQFDLTANIAALIGWGLVREIIPLGDTAPK